jgi:Omp85 superfamily domain
MLYLPTGPAHNAARRGGELGIVAAARSRGGRCALLAAAMVAPLMAAPSDQNGSDGPQQVVNVNARYTVESVNVLGGSNRSLSHSLRAELDHVVGQKMDHPRLEQLAGRIKKELQVADVSVHVAKGSRQDFVTVTFEVTKGTERAVDLEIAKFLYDSREGWSGEGDATIHADGNAFTFGIVSDDDLLPERYSGIRAKVERNSVGTDRLSVRFEFDNFHDQLDSDAASELSPGEMEMYRSRQVYSPEATLVIARPLELDFGTRFSRFRLSTPASRTESSNAVVSTLRYHPRWGSAEDPKHPGDPEQEVEASYSVEAATHVLASDPAYTSHTLRAHYRFHHLRNLVDVRFLAGKITGLAPLFDRFVLGNSSTLRGWDKYDLDPFGGSRVVYGSVNYNYRFLEVFYDTGAIWSHPQDRQQRQSVGVGLKKDNFQLAVALPLRDGRTEPVFYAGMNF